MIFPPKKYMLCSTFRHRGGRLSHRKMVANQRKLYILLATQLPIKERKTNLLQSVSSADMYSLKRYNFLLRHRSEFLTRGQGGGKFDCMAGEKNNTFRVKKKHQPDLSTRLSTAGAWEPRPPNIWRGGVGIWFCPPPQYLALILQNGAKIAWFKAMFC